MEFKPARFFPENKHKIVQGAYLPFGMGPRKCIGMQMMKLEAKILVFHILRRFRLEVETSKTPVPAVWDPMGGFQSIKGGCWIKNVPR